MLLLTAMEIVIDLRPESSSTAVATAVGFCVAAHLLPFATSPLSSGHSQSPNFLLLKKKLSFFSLVHAL